MDGALSAALAQALDTTVATLRPVAGGDLNEAFRAELADGDAVFVKTSADAAAGAFAAEAAGLAWLAQADAMRVPAVRAVADAAGAPRFLALEWLDAGRLSADGEEALGRGLAALHRTGAPAFGWTPDPPLRLGPLVLPGEPYDDAATWIAEARWLPLAQEADARGALPAGGLAAVERLAARAGELLGPAEPPARLHGDLWGGNVLATRDGAPVLIDPAAHGGPREVDLAMLRLFGGPSERCFAAYAEAFPLPDGHAERVALHQLTPLLVHAVLFGAGYGARAAAVAARYA